ncbi:hypothetical protein Tco_1185550 [Tanacetum coccineum]
MNVSSLTRQNVEDMPAEVNNKALNYFLSPFLSYKYHLTSLKPSNLNLTTKIFQMACSLPHTDSKVEALVQKLINEDKGRQNALLELAFWFEDSCVVREDLRKAYEKCNDISQESRALICTLLKESSEKDRKLHLSMYGKATQLERQMGAKLAWFQEKYSRRTRGGIDCSSSQANCPLTEKELHQLRMDEEALRETLE